MLSLACRWNTAQIKRLVNDISETPGFYRNLPAVNGAVEALNEMLDSGVDVWICTSPLSEFRNCVLEKYDWVHKHLGQRFVDRMIMCRQKAYVRGGFLIDDLPDPRRECALMPEWNHIVFDAPYNRGASPKLRIEKWRDWRAVLREGKARFGHS
jgi:5'-nucleotidase